MAYLHALCVHQMNRRQMTRAALIHIAYPAGEPWRVGALPPLSSSMQGGCASQGSRKIPDRCLHSTQQAPHSSPIDRLEDAYTVHV